MKSIIKTAAIAALLAAPAFAESHENAEGDAAMAEDDTAMAEMAAPTGDAAAGEKVFTKRCQTCHVVVNEAGETLAGKRARTGPNLYNVMGHQAGAVEDFRYGKSIVEAGEEGLIWTEEKLVAYVADPKAFLKDATGDDKAKSKMSFRLKKGDDAKDVYAYLMSLNSM